MAKSKKESATKVEAAAPASTTKPSKKSKRDAEVDVDLQKNPKKQKEELDQAVKPEKTEEPIAKKTPKKKKKKKAKVSPAKTSKQENVEQKTYAKQPKTLFVASLPFQTKKSDLEDFFKEVGEVVGVRLSRGFAHVEFDSVETAQKALKLKGKQLLGRDILLDFANVKPPPRNQVKTVFVTKFDKSVGETEMKTALRDHFIGCGKIKNISLPCNKKAGAIKGMAYLDFNEDGFNKALELNGSELGGHKIVVIEAMPRRQKPESSMEEEGL